MSLLLETAQGGTALRVDKLDEVFRFCLMGLNSTFYNSAFDQTNTFVNVVLSSGKTNPKATLATIARASELAPKQETSIMALALLCSLPEIRPLAWPYLGKIVRNGSHMITFIQTMRQARVGGWGRSVHRNIAAWYDSKEPRELVYQLAKYQGRSFLNRRLTQGQILKWTRPESEVNREFYDWAAFGTLPTSATPEAEYIRNLEALPEMREDYLLNAIAQYRFTWEMIPRDKLTPDVWEALVPDMPAVALLRNMGTLSRNDVDPELIVNTLARRRAHPLTVLVSWFMYRQGHGQRSRGEDWKVHESVLTALEAMFYRSFDHIEPNKTKTMVALDVSSSMTWNSFDGIDGLHARTVSAVLAMMQLRANPDTHVVAFSTNLVDMKLNAGMSLDDVIHEMAETKYGNTYSYLPFQRIINEQLDTEAVVMYTDNQTADHRTLPLKAQIRENQPLKFVNVSMVPNNYTFAYDEHDLDVVGYSSELPTTIDTFLRYV